MRVLVLGGYGLIGSGVCRRLMACAAHIPVGLGRSRQIGEAKLPAIAWRQADISRLTAPEDWLPLLEGIEAVVNCAGVLQQGLGDRLAAVQRDAMLALYTACRTAGISRFVQISAPGAAPGSNTDFYATKGEADAALKASGLDWTILRPALVISPEAYGGTALLRGLAACPVIQPLTLADARIDVVAASDVEIAVEAALGGKFDGCDLDLAADDAPTLETLVLEFRRWLGFRKPAAILRLPVWISAIAGRFADIAGWLGWRSSLRTTAQKVLANGVRTSPDAWKAAGGHVLASLDQIFAALPSTAQERRFSRLQFLYPPLLVMLAVFWIASGLIGAARYDRAFALLAGTLPPTAAHGAVILGILADLMIGLALLVRPLTRSAAIASLAVAGGYLLGASLWRPDLWLDPLGPMVKVFPALGLGLLFALIPLRR